MSEAALQQSISVIGASDMVAQAIVRSAKDVVEIFSDRERWSAVESELRSLLNGVFSANLIAARSSSSSRHRPTRSPRGSHAFRRTGFSFRSWRRCSV
jgi:hypothetical protein